MPPCQITSRTSIDTPLTRLVDVLADFRQWPAWSPWLVVEPGVRITYSDDQGSPGASCSWSGKLAGAGKMTLGSKTQSRLVMQIEFLDPRNSTARIEFDITQISDHCMVSWHMYGVPPRFMEKTMMKQLSMDCERGLTMLKEYIERGDVRSSTSIDGLCKLARQDYVGICNRSSLKQLPPVMQADFDVLYALFKHNGWSLDVIPFSIYHSLDSTHTEFTSAIPVSEIPAGLDEPFTTGSIQIPRGFRVTHTGAYENLGNAWSAAMQAIRLNGYKAVMSPVGIERYLNDHETLPAAELITEVIIAVN